MQRRAPWALTIYFVFLFCLLLWGRLPNDAACYGAGIRMIDSGVHRSLSERRPTPCCPACDGQREGAAQAAVPSSLFGGSAGKDGQGGHAPAEQRLARVAPRQHQAGGPLPLPPIAPDPRLVSLRTVVLRH